MVAATGSPEPSVHQENLKLVRGLSAQHRCLLGFIAKFERALPTSGEVEKFTLLLAEHLALEDDFVYEALAEHGALDAAFAGRLKCTMVELATVITDFVQHWCKAEPKNDPAGFARGLFEVSNALERRTRFEEEQIYPLLFASRLAAVS